MSTKASDLVNQAKQWATYYGDFTTGEEGAVLSVPLRVRAAWDANDADALADLFVANGSMLIGDEQLKGREDIRAYLSEAFSGAYHGTRLAERPVTIKLLTDDVALAVTDAAVLVDGQTEPNDDQLVRAMYVVVRQNGEWRLASHQTSPISG